MIITLLIVSLAFLWLGYESDWMRIRLLVGIEIPPIQRKSWEELKPWSIKRQHPFWLRYPEHMSPLTGWDWLKNTMHIIPEYKVELIGQGYKTTIHSKSTDALRNAFRVNRNPYLKVSL